MTFGIVYMPMKERRLVRIQEKGQVTLPVEVRRRLGLKKGDLVAVEATEQAVVITPQEVVAVKALDRIGELLREKGLTLEELIESGREERTKLIEEMYGIPKERAAAISRPSGGPAPRPDRPPGTTSPSAG